MQLLNPFQPHPRYEMVYRFAAGICGATASAGPIVRAIVAASAAEKKNEKSFEERRDQKREDMCRADSHRRLAILALQCSFESGCVDDGVLDAILERDGILLDLSGCSLNNADVIAMSRVLSACPRTAGISEL
jgi:hypothetical protein